MNKKDLINQLFTSMLNESSDYIIVNKALLNTVLHNLSTKQLSDIFTGTGTNLIEELKVITYSNANFHLVLKGVRELYKVPQGMLAKLAKVKQPDISTLESKGVDLARFSEERCNRIKNALIDIVTSKSLP